MITFKPIIRSHGREDLGPGVGWGLFQWQLGGGYRGLFGKNRPKSHLPQLSRTVFPSAVVGYSCTLGIGTVEAAQAEEKRDSFSLASL